MDIGSLVTQLWAFLLEHKYAGVGGLLCMGFVTLLTDRAKFLPTWNNPFRTFLGTLFGGVGLALNLVQAGGAEEGSAIINLIATTMPTLIAELLLVVKNKNDANKAYTGTGDIDLSKDEKDKSSFAKIRMGSKLLLMPLYVSILMLTSCVGAQKILSVISDADAYITSGQTAIQAIETAIDIFFLAKPNSDAKADIDKALIDVETGLEAAIEAVHGVENLSESELDLAFVNFKAAYLRLEKLLQETGVVQNGKMATRRGGQIDLPRPLAVRGIHK